MADKSTTATPGDGSKSKLPVSDWPIGDLLDKYREYISGASTIGGILMAKHRFTKEQLPKPPKSQSFKLITAELLEKVKKALKGRTVTAGEFDDFLYQNGIKPFPKTAPARGELKAAGEIETKENAKGTSTYVWLKGDAQGEPNSEPLTVPRRELDSKERVWGCLFRGRQPHSCSSWTHPHYPSARRRKSWRWSLRRRTSTWPSTLWERAERTR